MKDNKYQTKIIQGGFSEPILQPIFMVAFATIFLLIPLLGAITSIVLVAIPSFAIAIKIAEQQKRNNPLAIDYFWTSLSQLAEPIDILEILRDNNWSINEQILQRRLPKLSKPEVELITSILLNANVATRRANKARKPSQKVFTARPVIDKKSTNIFKPVQSFN